MIISLLPDKLGQDLSSQNIAGEYFYIHCDLNNEQEIKVSCKNVLQ